MSRLVHVERPEPDVLVIKKTRGELTVTEMFEAFRENRIDDICILAVQQMEFDGYLGIGQDKISSVMLHNISRADHCPVCSMVREEIWGQIYESAYQEGYKAAQEEKESGGTP